MQHRIPVEQLGLAGASMAEAVQACVHCGFCLATCPTYRLLGRESDSPRGRIYLMKGVLEGRLDLRPAVVEPLDRCLGCLACVTACPSGVRYDQLLVGLREHLEARLQIAAALREQGRPLPVHHSVEVLAQAYAPGAAG